MHIVICGSIAHIAQIRELRQALESLGHTVVIPPAEIADNTGASLSVETYYQLRQQSAAAPAWVWERKRSLMQAYFQHITRADAIVVANFFKKNIAHYIGGNTLIEMGIAFYLSKPLYLINPVPEVSWQEEILAMQPIILHGDLSAINKNI